MDSESYSKTIGMTAGGTRYRYLSATPDLLAACVGALSSEMPMTSDDFFRRLREEWDIVVSPSAATGTTLSDNLDGDELAINLRRFERLLIESGLASGPLRPDSACRRARGEERRMSDRLAVALIGHIRLIDATAKFLVIEAVPMPLARSLEAHWDADDPELPRLAVAMPDDAESIGEHGLRGSSVATLRNRSPRGLCIVVCEGAELAERQSIISFTPIAPADLLGSKDRLMLLSRGRSPVRADGYMAAFREAIATMPPSLRPSASAVAAYFDRVASGEDALVALPSIGAFRDACGVANIRGDRIRDNLTLASRRSSGDVIAPDDFARIRSRAERVLARPASSATTADKFMEMLENGADDVLVAVSYDEAREILVETRKGLASQTIEALKDFVTTLPPDRAEQIPLDVYIDEAKLLEQVDDRRAAAQTLLAFDTAEGGAAFDPTLRRRLSALLRERRFDATPGSCPEVGLARAILAIGSPPDAIDVIEPSHDDDPTGARQARDQLTLAIARMRLAHVLGILESRGCDIDPVLHGNVFGGADSETARRWFLESGLDRNRLSTLKIRVEGGPRSRRGDVGARPRRCRVAAMHSRVLGPTCTDSNCPYTSRHPLGRVVC